MKGILGHNIGAILLAVSCTAAYGSFFDNFDSYTPGVLVPRGGWQGWDSAPGASGSLVVAGPAASDPNSVQITGADDLVRQFSAATAGQWVFSLKQYIPGTGTGTTYNILMNVYNDGGPYEWSVQDAFNMDTGLVTADQDPAATKPTLPIVRDRWVDLRYDIDLSANTVSEYYDGALLSTHPWAGTPVAVAAVDLYANNVGPVYYDDIRLARMPGPPVWNSTTDSNWNTAANWNPDAAFPDAAGAVAILASVVPPAKTVNIGSTATIGTLVFDNPDAALNLSASAGQSLIMQSFTGSASISDDAGSHRISADILLASDANINVARADDTLTISGTINDDGAGKGITKSGPGTLTLSGSNAFWGATTIRGGTLRIGSLESLGSYVVFQGGTLQYPAGTGGDSSIDVSGKIPTVVSGQQVKIDTNNNNVSFNSGIGGDGGLTKYGAGTLTLAADNFYTGPTTVNAGTLVISSGTVATLNVPAGAAAITAGASATVANVSGTGQLAQHGAIGALRVTGGNVTTGAGATVTTVDLTGGKLNTQGNYLSVGAKITMPAGQPMVSIANSDIATPFGIKGSDLGATNIGGLQLNGGTVTISGPAGTASVLDRSSTPGTGTGTFSQSVTVSPGADVMAVTVSTYTAPAIDSWRLDFGGQPLARAVYKLSNNTTTITSAIFYLVHPTPGTATLSGTFTGASVSVVDYCTLSGVNTSASLVTGSDDSNGSITNVTLSDIVPGSVAVVGQALRQGSGTFPITTTATSGIAGNLPSGTSGNVLGAGGYVSGLANGSTTFTGTLPGYSGNRHPLTVAVFAPVPAPWEISQPGIDVEVTASSTLDFGGAIAVTLGDLTVQSDAALVLANGSSVAFSSLAGPSTSGLTASIPLTLSSGKMAGNMDGTGSLTKAGTGATLILSGNNTYSGGTSVQGGTLRIDGVSALPAGHSVTIGASGTMVLASGLSAAGTGGLAAAPVPEPSTLALLAIGAIGLLAWRRRPTS